MTHLAIPKSVVEIGENAFAGCASLASLTIARGVSKIADELFKNCASLTHIAIPKGVRKIGDYAFEGCTSLSSVSLPESLIEIGSGAFYGCSSLDSLSIPQNVEVVDCEAFELCDSLRMVRVCGPEGPEGLVVKSNVALVLAYRNAVDIEPGTIETSSIAAGCALSALENHAYRIEDYMRDYIRSNAQLICSILRYDTAAMCWMAKNGLIGENEIERISDECIRLGFPEAATVLRELTTEEAGRRKQEPESAIAADSCAEAEKKICFAGMVFVLTGLDDADKERAKEEITQRGGTVKSSTVLATNYLVVNTAYGRETVKYRRAQELIAKGKPIVIVTEGDFWAAVEESAE